MRYLVLATSIALLGGVLGVALVQAAEGVDIRCRWQAPDSGSPVQVYELQIKDVDGGLDTTITVPSQPGSEQVQVFEGEFLRRYIARVRGIDAQGRSGPWSNFSQVYVFEEEEPEP
jgi:hypothetical protein